MHDRNSGAYERQLRKGCGSRASDLSNQASFSRIIKIKPVLVKLALNFLLLHFLIFVLCAGAQVSVQWKVQVPI